jgi:hydrogenase nickel incorporation protein HypB
MEKNADGESHNHHHIHGHEDGHEHEHGHHHQQSAELNHGHQHHNQLDAHNHVHANQSGVVQVIHHHYYYNQVHVHHGSNKPLHHEPSHIEPSTQIISHHAEHGHRHSHSHKNEENQRIDAHFKHRNHENFSPEVDGDDLHYGLGPAHAHAPGMTQGRMVQIEQDILSKNSAIADKNRKFLQSRNIKTLNFVSSPGSGKTTLLTVTLNKLDPKQCFVIEGDQQTSNDADRIRATGAKAIQINTGKGCHLDAQMVAEAVARLMPANGTTLFIENVGNLVCPAAFDLGESHKVAILSVTEGEDKPLKYPDIFADADLMIINKIDLLPYLEFDLDGCIANARRVNPEVDIILVSASTGEGMQDWIDWLQEH